MRVPTPAVVLLFTLATAAPGHAASEISLVDQMVGPGSLLERTLAKTPFADKVLCLRLPDSPVEFGVIDDASLKAWVGPLRYTTNPNLLAVVDGPEDRPALRQRFVPSSRGSERVVASMNLPPRRTYEVEHSAYFEPGFQWGGEVESGKFGFGLAGGSAPTGGKIADDGFSARFIWKGKGDGTASVGVYVYSVDRTQNLPYGDEFELPGFTISPGEWFRAKMRLTTNSELSAKDGKIEIWIDDELLFERDGIQWQSAGEGPAIDQVQFSSFHGGNTDQWSPADEVHARFADMCVYKNREELPES